MESELRNEYVEVTREAIEARAQGDTDAETANLRRAQEIAATLNDEEKLHALAQVTEIDPETGQVIRKEHLDPADEIDWQTRSVKTNRTRKPDPPDEPQEPDS